MNKNKKNKDSNDRNYNKHNSKLEHIIDDDELHGEDYYKSTQIVTNYYYKPHE